ncbi:MAG: hypothetical protein ACK5LN_05510 [Propioniciclava sp.]
MPGQSQRGSLPLGVALGVAAGTGVSVLAWMLLPTQPEGPRTTVLPVPSPTGSVATTDPAQAPSPGAATATVSPTATASGSAAPDGIVRNLPAGSWVTVLKSLPQKVVSAEAALEQAESMGSPEHRPVVIDTNSFDKLNRDYWAVVVPGQSSRAESNAVCQALGIPLGNDCYPREL